jgi:predicted HicB family RNase H-like nuclease
MRIDNEQRFVLRLEVEMYEWLIIQAKKQHISLNSLLLQLIDRYREEKRMPR